MVVGHQKMAGDAEGKKLGFSFHVGGSKSSRKNADTGTRGRMTTTKTIENPPLPGRDFLRAVFFRFPPV